MSKKSGTTIRLIFVLSVLINIILAVYIIINDAKVSGITKKYDEVNQKFEDLTKKYNDLEKKHNELNDKYKKVVRKKQKTVYLTFDDGSSKNTDKIIDILSKYDIKATFFVVGLSKDEGYKKVEDEAYKKIVNSGHAIGLHSNRHDYEMYSNPKEFIKDINAVHDRVLKATGIDAKEIRLAGGSSNSFVSDANLNEISKYLTKNNFRYHDWNCDSNDGLSNSRTKESVIKSATNCSANKINVLMHDSIGKTSTVEALPTIIEHYQQEGYVFDIIDRDVDTIQHIPQI